MKKYFKLLTIFAVVLTAGSASAAVSTGYYDVDSDGQVDTVEINFGENIDTCTYEAGDWTINTAGSIDVTAVTAVTCNASIATLTVTTHVDITGGATDPIIIYTNQGNPNDMVINGTNLANTDFTAIDKAAPTILYTSIDSSNTSLNFAKEGDIVTFSVTYSENVVSTPNSATSANNVTTLDSDVSANDFNNDLIQFIVVDGDNGLVTPNNIDYSIDDMATVSNTRAVSSLGAIIGTVTTDTIVPAITSAAAVNVDENQTAVIDVDADDVNATTYAISGGGVDAAEFSIVEATGVITFNSAPDFENPTAVGGGNDYIVDVTSSDAAGNESLVQSITVTVVDLDEIPKFTVGAGSFFVPLEISISENQTAVTTVTAVDPEGTAITYSLIDNAGSPDSHLFSVGTNGAVSFNAAADFENPMDHNNNNVYRIRVEAQDETNVHTGSTYINVTVTDIDEPSRRSSGSRRVSKEKLKEIFAKAEETKEEVKEETKEEVKGTTCSYTYSKMIKRGSRGDYVKQLQAILNGLGFNTGVADGIVGPNTLEGIKAFQQAMGIMADGVFGPQSNGKLSLKCSA